MSSRKKLTIRTRRRAMNKWLLSRKFKTDDLNSSRLFDNSTFYTSFISDLRSSERSVYIESPFITSRRMSELLPIFAQLRRKGLHIIVNTRCPDEHDGNYANQAANAVLSMQTLGIKVLYTVKHHRKLAIIDGTVLWEGSLNILSQNDSCEMMRRSKSATLVRQMIEFTGMSQYF